jgi:hypothetical protein
VDRRRLKECQNKKDEIEAMKYKRNTFKIKSRKDMSRFPDMETRLYAWVMENSNLVEYGKSLVHYWHY